MSVLKSRSMSIGKDEQENVALVKPDIESGDGGKSRSVKGLYPFIAFLLIGTAELYGYNGFLNSSFNVFNVIYNIPVPPTITVCYFTLNCIVTILAIVFPTVFVRPIMTYVGLILTLIDAVLYPSSSYASPGAALPLFHLMGCFMGISSAIIGASGFGYANYFDQNYGSVMSAGLGVAGILSFAIFFIAQYAIFSDSTRGGVLGANWVVQGFSIVISMFTLAFSIKFFNDPNVRLIVNKQRVEQEESKRKQLLQQKDDTVEESIMEVFKASFSIVLTLFWTMFVTLFCFPAFGPLRWNGTPLDTNILLGLYQLGDLIGRFSPNFVPILMLKKPFIIGLGLFRSILIVTFLLCKELGTIPALNNMFFLIFQMLFLSISNGILNTSCLVRAPERARTNIGKARTSAIALLALMVGLTAGQWVGVLYLTFYGP